MMRKPLADTSRPAKSKQVGPQSVGRIFSILDTIAGARIGATLSDLARTTASPKTSLVGLLAGLTAEGCLVRDAAGRYSLGPRIHALAMRALAGRELAELVHPILEALVEATGETAVLGALASDADVAIYLDKVESPNSIRYAVSIGERRDLYCTAMGKALLAYFKPQRLKRYLESTPRQKYTPATITGSKQLLAEMARIQQQGIARSNGERVSGASALACPIFSSDGSVVAALLIAGPSERMRTSERNNERLLKDAAAACTRLAGGRRLRTPEAGLSASPSGRPS